MPSSEETGPVRASSPAIEPPRAVRRTRDLRRTVAVAATGLAIIGVAAALIARNVRNGDAADAAPAAPAAATSTAPAVPDGMALQGHAGPARSVSISPTGDRVLAIRDRGVDVWKIDGTHAAWLGVDGDRVAGAAWSRDGVRVLLWGPDGTVRLWNADTGAMLQTVQAGMGFVAGAELADDDHAVITGTDGVRRTWDLRSGAVKVERNLGKPPAAPIQIDALAPDGQLRAHVDPDGMVRLSRAI